eukprot:TRINITY_DN277_c0_g2_i2.p1 TRINITY_DN277_c0_g2~~TRINITY_DN277_c0_g2_i2.p1  ORF type:complete len:102 (+),score=11.71 TRINITY_DN277_c0_g2_i2:380-685(+)
MRIGTTTVEHEGYGKVCANEMINNSKIMIHSCGGNNEVPVGSRTKDKLDKVLCMKNFKQCESTKQLRLPHNRIMHLSGGKNQVSPRNWQIEETEGNLQMFA